MSLVMSLMIVFVSVVTFVPGGGVASASGLWTRIDGGGLNANPPYGASRPNAVVYGDALFVVWQENGKIRAKKYEDGIWSPVDGGVGLNVDPAHTAEQPKLAVFDDGLYASWSENNSSYSQIRVKKYISDGVWAVVDGGSGLNVSSSTGYAPDLAAFDGALYATWYEGPGGYKAQVKKYNGAVWTSVVEGPGLTLASGNVNNPKLAVFDDSLFITWQENLSAYPSPSQSYIPVKRYGGETTWSDTNDGNGLNSDPNMSAAFPRLVTFGDRLFATWRESNGTGLQVRVKVYDNVSGWTWADGGGLNADPSRTALSPAMTVYNNSLYAIWPELNANSTAQVRVKKYDGTGWSFVDGGTGLNADPSKPAADPILAAFGNGLYAVWAEGNQIRVARYEEGVPSDPNQAPTVSGVTVSGTAQVGQTLAGGYTYVDADHDAEGATTFQWYAADDASGTNKAAIGGATSKTLLLDPAQAGKYISFEVTPVAATGTSSGLPAGSEAVGPVLTGAAMEGSGTEEDPYIVTTAAELDGIRDNLSAHYKLGNDLDLSGYENWMPIGYDAIFLGTFDGDGHVIRGLNINSEINPAGLFAESYGIIRNVGLEDVSVASISSGAYNSAFVGGLIGRNSGTVENSYVTGNVSGNDYVGGLVGYNDVSAAIRNSYAISEVTGGFYVGGLVGFNAAMSDIEEEYRGQISNSYAIGSVGGYDNVGGLVGINHGVLENSYVYGTAGASEGLESPVANNGEYGFSDTSFAKTQDEMRQESTFAGWDFDDIWTIDEGNDYPRLQIFQQSSPAPELDGFSWAVGGAVGTTQATSVPEGTLKYVIGTGGAYPRPTLGSDASVLGYVNDLIRNADIPVLSGQHLYIVEVDAEGRIVKWADVAVEDNHIAQPEPTSGTGSAEDPYVVTTAAGLDSIRDNLGAHYKLGNDIDLSGYENWAPIGDINHPFTGSLDGTKHVITGLKMDVSTAVYDFVGLFGVVGRAGALRNVILEDAQVTSEGEAGVVGSLIGYNWGTIRNSYASGSVTGNGAIGGLAGGNDVSGVITRSYANVAVTALGNNNFIGGLIGTNSGEASDNYAAGSVTADGVGNYVGGLVGYNLNAAIRNSYAYGLVSSGSSGSATVGGLIGKNSGSSTVISSYYDRINSGQEDKGKGEPKSTAEMMRMDTFAAWDFDNIWFIQEGVDYPKLRALSVLVPDAPELTGFTWAQGSATGTTQATVVPAIASGHTLNYTVGAAGAYTRPSVGANATGLGYLQTLTANHNIAVTGGQHLYIVEVDADGKIVKWADITVSNSQIKPYPSGDSGSPGSGGSPGTGGGSGTGPSPVPTPQPTEGDEGVAVIVNGKEQARTATAKVTTVDNKKLTTVTVDEQKLNKVLATVDQGYVVTVPVSNHSDVVIGELNARMVKNMESKNAVLEVKTERAGYTLPAMQINVDAISSQIGSGVALEDIKVRVEIANMPDNQLAVTPDPSGNIRIVAPAVDFKITAVYGGKEVTVDRFNAYVERTIAIPDGVDPNKITTGIVVKADGSIAHVPTKVTQINGVYYATINSLTNSVYSVIYNNKTFEDIAGHWAQNSIENLASRLVVNGADDQRYLPDNEITRAEFAAIVVRALGLQKADQTGQFSDVNPQDWFYEAVSVGSSYGLVQGYTDGKFEPKQNITRQEAMAILTRAMALAGMDTTISSEEQERLLADFADSNQFGDWAKPAAALNIRLGIVIGNQGKVLPQQLITKAETAAIVERLLQAANLI